MNDWQTSIGILAGFISLFGFIPYIAAIWQRKTKPSPATWWIWTIVGFLLLASSYASGARSTIWVFACLAVGHLLIALLSIKYGEGGWNTFDQTCLVGAGASLLLWWWQDSPIIALCLNIAIDFLGALPTIKKVYYRPQTEEPTTWVIFLIAHTLNLCALTDWSFAVLAYPLYLFCIVATVVVLILRSPIQNKLNLYRLTKKRKSKNIKTIQTKT
jgi:hypothetical protein